MSVPVRTTAIENSFHENSQRPPVEPGAETVQSGEPVGSTVSGWGSPGKFTTMGRSSPVSMPSVSHAHIAEKVGFHGGGGARGGREACEGGCGGPGSRSPPAYLRWARHLHILLQDPDGVALFRRYLEAEGQVHADTLDFWFACEGLRKQTDAENVMRLVKVIYRRYFVKMELGIGSDLRREVHQRIKESGSGSGGLAVSVFDRAQQQVERLITDTMYPNFLRSELYLQHVQAMQAGSNTTSTGSDSSLSSSSGSGGGSGGGGAYGGGSNTTSSGSGGGGVQASTGGGYLATLHEDCELESHAASTVPAMSSRDAPRGSAALPLTRDMLLATQKRRASELRPKPEAYAGLYLQTHAKPSSNWVHHSSYNPVSRQDSELQSLSSDARTDSDCLSMTDTSSIREGSGSHHRYSKKQYQLHCKQVKENASLNRDPYMHHTVIPRTQRVQKEQTYPMKPDEFAAILIEKLENLKKDQETKESLDRKLMETGEITDNVGSIGPTTLADAIRGKLRVEDDGDDQDILDQHVSRVWSDRTPGLASPPEFLRRPRPPIPPNHGKMSSSNVPPSMMSPFSMPMHMYQSKTHQRHSHSHSRKEKDVFSNFSSDSGNVHDFTEGSEHRMHVPKSKSMPEYTDTLQSSHDGRFRQTGFRDWSVSGSGSGGGSRRWSSKKTELTDSGVSVVSDTPSLAHTNKDRRVLSWLMESDKQHMVGGGLSQVCGGGGGSGIGGGDSTSSYGGKSHRCGSSRSGSLERPPRPVTTGGGGARGGSGGQGAAQPAQPFVADPSMPPLPSPHTPDQLEEARRRLLEDETRTKQPRPRFPNKSVEPSASHSHSSGSTLRRSGGGGGGSRGSSRGAEPPLPAPPPIHDAPCTIVVFSFCDEQFPYRTKIPGQHVTLRQFKEYLPKKGLYRYFFKTECEDLDMKVIQEEIVDDNEVLPLWEGKVMAQVKPVE